MTIHLVIGLLCRSRLAEAGSETERQALLGVDVETRRKAIKADKLSQLKEEYRKDSWPTNTQYGWVWVEDGTEPTVPVGNA